MMRGVIESIMAHLSSEPHSIPAHWVDVKGAPAYPYALLWGTAGLLGTDKLCDRADLDDTVAVTWVSLDPIWCLELRGAGRAALEGFVPESATWAMQPMTLLKRAGQDVRADRDVQLPDGNTYPYFAVDRFRLAGDLL